MYLKKKPYALKNHFMYPLVFKMDPLHKRDVHTMSQELKKPLLQRF